MNLCCEVGSLCCEFVILCYCDASAGDLYLIVRSDYGWLGLECTKHCGHCRSRTTMNGVTSAFQESRHSMPRVSLTQSVQA
jgi:hypothetical protein